MKRGRTPEEKRDAELEQLAGQIPNQVVLEAMLSQYDERWRKAIRDRIRPFLKFELVDKLEMHMGLTAPADRLNVTVLPSAVKIVDSGAQEEKCS